MGRSPMERAHKKAPGRGAGKKKGPGRMERSGPKERRRPTLPLGVAVPSAQTGLTSLFGMVRGGPRRHGHLRSSAGRRPATYIVDIIMGQGGRPIGNTRGARKGRPPRWQRKDLRAPPLRGGARRRKPTGD